MPQPPSTERCLQGRDWDHSVYAEYLIPEELHGGLDRYLKHHIRPGGFLYATLTNDLKDAMLRWAGAADFSGIPHGVDNPSEGLIRFYCAEIPAPAWGSVANVEAWLKETPQ